MVFVVRERQMAIYRDEPHDCIWLTGAIMTEAGLACDVALKMIASPGDAGLLAAAATAKNATTVKQ